MSLKSPLGHARGLGSARSGFHHWWMQRLTAVALLPLMAWFIYSLMTIALTRHVEPIIAWLHSPIHAILLSMMVVAVFWHKKLGLQVVIEDYVHKECWKVLLLVSVNFAAITLALMALFAIATLHFSPPVLDSDLLQTPPLTLPPTVPTKP